jgi:hypothetical protein
MKKRPSIAVRTGRALGLCLLFGSGCGGRAVTVEGDGGGGPVSAGATSYAGAANRAGGAGAGEGGASHGGASYGGAGNTGSAGAPAAGAGNSCGNVSCPANTCTIDQVPMTLPGTCCPICVSPCLQQVCPGLACASGYQLQTQPGQCCPSCVPIPMLDCKSGQVTYAQLRAQSSDKYSQGCASDRDCSMVAVSNRCEMACSYIPVWDQVAMDLEPALDENAAVDCAGCAESPPIQCVAAPPVACKAGQCVEASLD